MRRTLAALAVVAVAGCSSLGTVHTVVVPRDLPPAQLLAHCPAPPQPAGKTNGDLARWLRAFDVALEACNADKAALRDWAK